MKISKRMKEVRKAEMIEYVEKFKIYAKSWKVSKNERNREL